MTIDSSELGLRKSRQANKTGLASLGSVDGVAAVYHRRTCVGVYAIESLSPAGAVLRGGPKLEVGQELRMILRFAHGKGMQVSAQVIRRYEERRSEPRWCVAFPDLPHQLEDGIAEFLRTERAANTTRPVVVVLGNRDQTHDQLRESLAAMGWEAVLFVTPRDALRWMDTSMVCFEGIIIDSLFLRATGHGYLDFLASRFPDKRRLLILREGPDTVPLPFGAIDGVLDFPLRQEGLASALGVATDDRGPAKRVLFVDDEPRVFEGLRNLLRHRLPDYELVWAANGDDALAELRRRRFRTVVSDICMPGMDGISFLSTVRKRDPSVFRVVLTGFEVAGAQAVAHRVLHKPCPAHTLGEVISQRSVP